MGQVPRSQRVRKRFEAAFAAADRPLQTGETQDVSQHGLGLQGGTSYPVGTELRIVIRPADYLPLELRGKVVWATSGTMGVRLAGAHQRYLELVETSITAEAERNRRATSDPNVPRLDPVLMRELAERRSREATLAPEFRSGIRSRTPAPIAPLPLPPMQLRQPSLSGMRPAPELPDLPDLPEKTPVDLRMPGRADARPPRFDELLPVRLGTHPTQLDIKGFLVNVSSTGISVQCAFQWARGTRVAVAIALPEGQARVDGMVAWCRAETPRTHLIGIRLLSTTPTYLELVSEDRQRS